MEKTVTDKKGFGKAAWIATGENLTGKETTESFEEYWVEDDNRNILHLTSYKTKAFKKFVKACAIFKHPINMQIEGQKLKLSSYVPEVSVVVELSMSILIESNWDCSVTFDSENLLKVLTFFKHDLTISQEVNQNDEQNPSLNPHQFVGGCGTRAVLMPLRIK